MTRPCRANAVGRGITHAIRASAADPTTPADWIHFCLAAAAEAINEARQSWTADVSKIGSAQKLLRDLHDEELDGPLEPLQPTELDEREFHEAGATAYRCCMPQLTSRRNVQAYIACIAAGAGKKYLSGADARGLLYTAQLALAAYPKRNSSKTRRAI